MATVAERLRQTEKGQLTYYTDWTPKDLKLDEYVPKLIQKVVPIFEIGSIKAILEAIDDDSQVALENHEEEKARESWQREQTANETLKEDVLYETQAAYNFEAQLRDHERSIQEEKRRSDLALLQKQQKFREDIIKKTEEAAKLRRQREKEKRQKEVEEERRFRKQLEESAMRIQREMQEQQDHLMKTRKQQEEERRLKFLRLEQQKQKEDFQKYEKLNLKISTIYEEILGKMQEFNQKYSADVSQTRIPSLLQNISQIYHQTDAVFSAVKHQEKVSEEQLSQTENNLAIIKINEDNLVKELEILGAKCREIQILEERKRQELIMKQQKEAAEAKRQAEINAKAQQAASSTQENKTLSLKGNYEKLKSKMAEYEAAGSKLTSSGSQELKKLVMHLSKAISVPIGSITGRSGSDVKRVSRTLTNIVKGNQVTVSNKTLSTKGNSIALKFAENLIAKKIVTQANKQVSSNFSSAFSIAFIVISVWAESKDFGDLFLAHLHTKCLYSIPMYYKLKSSEDEKTQFKAMGYEISDDGQIEEQDKFLRRMSGLIRLYAAIIQSPLPPGVSSHPHGLEKGWRWLSEFLNMEPIMDISTTVLYDFLEVAGHALMKTYKSQFEKLLYVICHDFYPKLEAVAEDRAPLARLKLFLEKCIREKKVPVPEGRLDRGFWNTYHSGEVVGD